MEYIFKISKNANKIYLLKESFYFFILLHFLLSIGCNRIPYINKFGMNLRGQAERAEGEGKYSQALDLYERCIDQTAEGAAIHYRMALLYDSKLQSPIGALYHFQRFVEKAPTDPRLKEIQKDIKRLRLLLASQLSEGVIVSRADAIRLRNENLRLQTQLTSLRSQKETSGTLTPGKNEAAQGFSTHPITYAAEKLVGEETRTYKVGKGDTLALISRKFYKTSQRWKDIADANQNQLGGSSHLKVGMTLIIP